MKKLICLLVLVMILSGCATVSSISPKLSLGMSKQEVLEKCGRPFQAGVIPNNNKEVLERFTYKEIETLMFFGGRPKSTYTYVYFADGKVIYYGSNPNMPTEESQSDTLSQ